VSSIITRKALIAWSTIFGNPVKPVPELAYIVTDYRGRRIVTWSDVLDARRKRQQERLRLVRYTPEWRAYRVWVAYFDMPLMGGWQAFIDRGARQCGGWIDRDRSWLKPVLMRMFPLLLPLGTAGEQWEHWKITFAGRFERRRQDRRPVGVTYVWWNEHEEPQFSPPALSRSRQS
jgi:hypothetical protein